ncbi:hypothetical protein G6F68_016464 [Rhizopus microsporus]|nr:hypothetical protein G6F68_016464 [Rhizopus microsporus]
MAHTRKIQQINNQQTTFNPTASSQQLYFAHQMALQQHMQQQQQQQRQQQQQQQYPVNMAQQPNTVSSLDVSTNNPMYTFNPQPVTINQDMTIPASNRQQAFSQKQPVMMTQRPPATNITKSNVVFLVKQLDENVRKNKGKHSL